MIYLDAVYIAKFYVDEPDSERVRNFLATAQPAASCLHAMAEVASVFHRKLREGTVPQTDFDNFCAQFEADCEAGLWTWLPLPESLVHAARRRISKLPPTTFLRAADALHLAYANVSFCTPTRAALMSCRYQLRYGVEDLTNATGPLPLAAKTLPARLQAAGYTTGMVGKWHLGDAAGFTPLDRGFAPPPRRSDGGWVNLGINSVEKISLEPAVGAAPVSPNHSFTLTRFADDRGPGAKAGQERLVGIVRTSATSGYYVDVFRSQSALPAQFHARLDAPLYPRCRGP